MHIQRVETICVIAVQSILPSLTHDLTGQRPAAIVSPLAGTTRDVVETAVNIGGYPVVLSDTAGLRHSEDIIEKEGVRRARLRYGYKLRKQRISALV